MTILPFTASLRLVTPHHRPVLPLAGVLVLTISTFSTSPSTCQRFCEGHIVRPREQRHGIEISPCASLNPSEISVTTTMSGTFTYHFDTPVYKGTTALHTGLYINGEWVNPVQGSATADIINPANGKTITSVSVGTAADVDRAVVAAQNAYKTVWGLRCPGSARGRLLNKLADLVEEHQNELAALDALNIGKAFHTVLAGDIPFSIATLRYFAGWADKVQGKTMETNENKLAYTRHEPYGVVGQITPWNAPLLMVIIKIAPALATGNTIVLKPSEVTPLSALRIADLITEAGFPPGVVNIVNGYGLTVGAAIASHRQIAKVAFTGSAGVGRAIMRASTESNLKPVTLELGGKSPTIVFDDANLEQAVKWASMGIFYASGQACVAGSRIFVQESIHEEFLKRFTETAKALAGAIGDPFAQGSQHGPLISQAQLDRVLGYIEAGKQEGATLHVGGARHGNEGYFVQPTIFTNLKPDMKIVREEIFGPVACIIKFKTEEEVIEMANNTVYGLSCNVFSQNISRAIRVTHALEAGNCWVNCASTAEVGVPFGGYKESGIGREMGEYALDTYTQVKAIHVNLGLNL
ncbi:putative aldehyde dehydrogenase family protein [Lyophyllum shimeji]|uniref:Aldehyde dehydrogenase family protein n=1 Tax=Lyophyllum shimeji TaxID=47721 RepID=A0A9P3UPC3_LYOSH|nr:putative aldehyde dehydrogenase family protein [Lyophyllum shimeji]